MERTTSTREKYYIKVDINTIEEPSTRIELNSSVETLSYDYLYHLIEDEFQLQSDAFSLKYICQQTKKIKKLDLGFLVSVRDLAANFLEIILVTKSFQPNILKKHLFLQKWFY